MHVRARLAAGSLPLSEPPALFRPLHDCLSMRKKIKIRHSLTFCPILSRQETKTKSDIAEHSLSFEWVFLWAFLQVEISWNVEDVVLMQELTPGGPQKVWVQSQTTFATLHKNEEGRWEVP